MRAPVPVASPRAIGLRAPLAPHRASARLLGRRQAAGVPGAPRSPAALQRAPPAVGGGCLVALLPLLRRLERRRRRRPWAAPRRAKGAATLATPRNRTPLWTLKATQLLIFAANVCLARYITVYYAQIGLSRQLMGVLLFVMPIASFWGGLFWSAVVDRTLDYKRTLAGTSVAGIFVVFTYLVPAVQRCFPLLVVVTALHGFLASPSGPIVDALCLKVLEENQVTDEDYGDQRLWSAVGWGGMALAAGWLVDAFGTPSMFFCFAALVTTNVGIILRWMPGAPSADGQALHRRGDGRDAKSSAAGSDGAEAASTKTWLAALRSFDVAWLLVNLVVYGSLMALLENFLNVFLLQDFANTPKVLLGMSTAVMCAFEIPVFKCIGRVWGRGGSTSRIVGVLVTAEVLLAVRCVLYALLPSERPWLVLLVEPLHGFTFAAMWCATVEYARRLAPPGTEAKMQALLNGLFYYISFAVGSFAWGSMVQRPPEGLGFRRCFYLDAALICGWLLVWLVGWSLSRRVCERDSDQKAFLLR